ncbi:chemotaxis protein [Yersinia enterocolitica]|uniref:chemotaxis protein n=1 Tax=Yersinia enterocolitica TaxID=630 RepID=UPI001C8D030B|nr:chemotaxis protein [Yersinia enterocolitica]MBX9477181.1 chemotaxis protein [Yersinia enterocolitica]
MNMTVNHQITLPEQNKISTEKYNEGAGNNINDMILDLSNIMIKSYILFKRNRDLLSAYSEKQPALVFEMQKISMQNKREAIDKTWSGALANGVCSIISGTVSGVGAVTSLKLGDIATHSGSALGQLGAGSGKLVEGDMARNAELLRMTSDMQSSSAQSYNKNISDIWDKMNETRQNMKDLSNTISSMIGQISMAVKL